MSLSTRELTWILEELEPALRGATIRGIHDDGADAIWITARTPGRNLCVMLSTAVGAHRVHFLVDRDRPRTHTAPRAFTQQLRKHLVGARVEAFEQVPGERIVELRCVGMPTSELGGRAILLAELFGRGGVGLLDDEGTVRGVSRMHPRLYPGARYERPAPAGGAGSRRALRFVDDGAPLARSHAIDAFYLGLADRRAIADRRARLESRLRRAHHKATRRTEALRRDLEKAEAAQVGKAHGDLLAANFHRIEPGATEITVENFYDEMRPVTIPLDPTLAPNANIDRCYRRFKRFQRALPDIRRRLEAAIDAATSASDLLEALRESHSPDELDDIEALADEAHIPRRAVQKRAPRGQAPSLPYRAFESAAGLPIWVGRSASGNDELTFRHAKGNDLWLHARDVPGSHVVVRLPRGGEPDEQTLLDAATLAAHYSRARRENVVDVLYTRRKHVRRAPGGVAGRVLTAQTKNIAVRLERARLERLFAESEPPGLA